MSNNSTLREQIIQAAKSCGADVVGFGCIDRFDDPMIKQIYPETRTVIAVGLRVLRGAFRGIEEGSTYYQYSTNGVETIEETVMPGVLLRVCNAVEDAGFTAIPQRRNQMLRASAEALNPEMLHTEWYESGAKEPQMDFDAAAVNCGLGERGLSGAVLNDEYGPFIRYAFVLTDADLEATPLVVPHLCDNCGECIKACPGHAINAEGELNLIQCATYYRGANMTTNPYMPPEAYAGHAKREAIVDGTADLTMEEACDVMADTYFYPPMKHGYVTSICGRACDRACYVHLEEKGLLSKKFLTPFRKRPVWSLPIILDK